MPKQVVSPKAMPRHLLLQVDNYMKDNKNQHLLAFLSLLSTSEVFEKVQLRFLVVGHTHEDIDGCFRCLSKKLRDQNNYILANLMKAFMVS
jgi:CO dehydrogenase nickel-insertion accessory protein CooC1